MLLINAIFGVPSGFTTARRVGWCLRVARRRGQSWRGGLRCNIRRLALQAIGSNNGACCWSSVGFRVPCNPAEGSLVPQHFGADGVYFADHVLLLVWLFEYRAFATTGSPSTSNCGEQSSWCGVDFIPVFASRHVRARRHFGLLVVLAHGMEDQRHGAQDYCYDCYAGYAQW